MRALDNASIAAILEDLDDQVVTEQGYTRRELSAAFDTVRSSLGWKAPIKSLCKAIDCDLIATAVAFFHGERPQFFPPACAAVAAEGWVEVHGRGYNAITGEE